MAGFLLAWASGMSEAMGQLRVLSGPSGGVEFGMPMDVEQAWNGAPWSLYPMQGTFSSRSVHAGSQVMLPELFPGFSLSVRMGLAFGSETFRSDAVPGPPVTGRPSSNTDNFTFAVNTSSLSGELDLRARYELARMGGMGIGAGAGPWIGYQFFSRLSYEDEVVDTLTGRFGATVVRDGSTFGIDPFHYGITVAAALDIPLGSHGVLLLEPYFRADLRALANTPSFAPISFGADLAYLFDMNPAPIPAPRSDTPPPPQQPAMTPREEEPPLAAKIDIYSVDPNGDHRQVSELYPDTITQRRQMPFPGAIFFDRDSSAPPARYVRYDRIGSDGFTFGSLAGLSPRDIYYHALNILGYRLRQYPASRARLIGSRSKDEPQPLARSRAEAVRDYLLASWGIDSARLTIATESMGSSVAHGAMPADAERCVRIETPRQVGAPLMVEWRTRRFRQPTFDLQPEIRAKKGVKRWEIVVRQGGREIGRTTGSTGLDLALHTPEDLADTALPPLEAELIVEDSTGATTFARDTLPLRIVSSPPTQMTPRTLSESSSYLLLGSAYGHQGETTGINASLRQIADSIGSRARVTVTGPGREGRSSGSALRAEEVAGTLRTLLGGRGINVSTATTPAMSLDSQYPEERMLAGGVNITIER